MDPLKPQSEKYVQIFCYLIAGGLGALVNIGLYSLFLFQLHIWYVTSAVLAFSCALVVSFLLQKHFTFKNKSRENTHKQITIYVFIGIFNVAMNALILFLFVNELGVGKLVAEIISNAIVASWSFFAYKYIAFKPLNQSNQSKQ